MNRPIWNKTLLNRAIKENFADHMLVIVSNREPYSHKRAGDRIELEKAIGGVSVVFDSLMKRTNGVWVADGSGTADRETADQKGRLMVPPDNPRYTLRRVWLRDWERERYYDGFANQTLWPLCHIVFAEPRFSTEDWEAYQAVNRRFAKVVLEEVKGKKAVVWIQDYHLALVAQYLREARPDLVIAQFWHIPWPPREIFRICPWRKEIIAGLLHNDLIGFHGYRHVNNFLENVAKEVEAAVNYEDLEAVFNERTVKIGAYPISIDSDEVVAKSNRARKNRVLLSKYISGSYQYVALGVDRLDYTKGIPNRLRAIGKFLEDNPGFRGKFVYLGIGAPSRSRIPRYQALGQEVAELTEAINKRYATNDWKPIHQLNQSVDRDEIIKLYRLVDMGLVTPLDDGMNLVAKEFVMAAKPTAALVLSGNIGAAKELTHALFVNPYSIDDIAGSIRLALTLPSRERRERMKRMKKSISERNVFRWAGKIILELAESQRELSVDDEYSW